MRKSGSLRFVTMRNFTFRAEAKMREKNWSLQGGAFPQKGPHPNPYQVHLSFRTQSLSVLSADHRHPCPLFLRKQVQGGPFKTHRNAAFLSTLVSFSQPKPSSVPSQPLPFLPCGSLIMFLDVLTHLWPNAFSLELIWDEMGVFSKGAFLRG